MSRASWFLFLACGVCLLLPPATVQSQLPPANQGGDRIRQLEMEQQARLAKLKELEAQQARLKTEMDAALAQYRQMEQQLQAEKERLPREAPRPGPTTVEARLERLERLVLALERELRESRSGQSREIKAPGATFTAVDFQALANQKRSDNIGSNNYPGNTLESLAAGEKRLLGIPFLIGEGILHVGSTRLPDKPEKITGIKVGKKLAKLHFLHATAYYEEEEVPIGSYTVRYADGTTESIPIVNNKDVTD